VTVLSDGDDDPVVPAGDAGRVPLPAHQNKGYKLRATFTVSLITLTVKMNFFSLL
jgi:hypothetical protein